jgi:uncharacterized protein
LKSDDSRQSTRLIYLHGFLSSPKSEKAKSLIEYAQNELIELIDQGKLEVLVPALPHKPKQAISFIEELIIGSARTVLIGSSLGGFYSIYFAEKFQCKAVLVNPLVTLQESLADSFLGHHINPYSGEEFEIEMADAEYLLSLEHTDIKEHEKYLLLLEEGDEVLDYKLALEKLHRAPQHVLPGGKHRFENFEKYIPEIIKFAQL